MLTIALYDWLAARARGDASSAAREALTELWDRLRTATRETEALNLDRKLHVLAMFEEISARARFL
jgi:Arc/MetJ-type ribon-helix-helix transcriptional regulator